MGLSLRPEDAVVSSGFLDDEDVIIKTVRAEMFDYAGQRANDPSPAIAVEYCRDGEDKSNKQYYTAGSSKHQIPSADGKTFDNLRPNPEEQNGFPENCNAIMWLQSIINAGFPTDKLGDDLSVFDGMAVHVNQVPAPERTGLSGTKDKTILIVTKINALPGEKKAKSKSTVKTGTKGSKAKTATPAKTTAAATDTDAADEVTTRAAEVLLIALASAGPEGIKKAALIPKVVPLITGDDPLRSKIVPKIIEDAFLTTQAGWTYANGIVTL
jgi:hypothetical protein